MSVGLPVFSKLALLLIFRLILAPDADFLKRPDLSTSTLLEARGTCVARSVISSFCLLCSPSSLLLLLTVDALWCVLLSLVFCSSCIFGLPNMAAFCVDLMISPGGT